MPLVRKLDYNSTEGQSPNPFPDHQSNNPFADPPPLYQSGLAYSPRLSAGSGYAYSPGPSYSSGSLYAPNVSPSFAQRAPQYSGPPSVSSQVAVPADDPYAFLSTFDTIFVIDDSASMQGSRWKEVSNTLKSITPICTVRDADGIDIWFLNHASIYRNVNDVYAVERIFNSVTPTGSTPIGTRLYTILNPYIKALQRRETKKPLNIIVITDGAATDDPESVILDAAKRLDAIQAPPWQVGIQFFQVGDDREAAEVLRELDDALVDMGFERDMVDTVQNYERGASLSADMILKTVLGGVHRRLDRKKVT